MDEDNRVMDPDDEADSGSMFKSNKIMIGMVLIAILAVLIGMGGQRVAQDKDAHVYAAQQNAQERADRIAGFDEAESEAGATR